MKYLKISNVGEIENAALYLLASTKRGQADKIGQFGSGNKYQLCYFVRNNYEYKVFSGTREIEIKTVPTKLRDQEVNVIYVDGKETSLTDQMGPTWELWQSLREIYCNAIDEGDPNIEIVTDIQPVEGETHFYIGFNSEINAFMENFDKYFANKDNVLFSCSIGKIMRKQGEVANVYRKGIRCIDSHAPSIFDYDLNNIPINESRLIERGWQRDEEIWKLIQRCTDIRIIDKIFRNILTLDSSPIEMPESGFSTLCFPFDQSEEFKTFISSVKIIPVAYSVFFTSEELKDYIIVPARVYSEFQGQISSDEYMKGITKTAKHLYRTVIPSPVIQATIDRALEFFKECGMDIPYDIQVAQFDNKKVYGTVDETTNAIILSNLGIERGIQETVDTIYEEYIHLKYNVNDETREMQSALIRESINYMKKKNTYII